MARDAMRGGAHRRGGDARMMRGRKRRHRAADRVRERGVWVGTGSRAARDDAGRSAADAAAADGEEADAAERDGTAAGRRGRRTGGSAGRAAESTGWGTARQAMG